MNKQELISQIKDRIAYGQEEQGRYEAMHGELNAEFGDLHSTWSEMADWHKGRAGAYSVVLELLDELESL